VVKLHIKKIFIHEGTVKQREVTKMENIYYNSLYDILQRPILHAERRTVLNHLKNKIVKLHNARLTGDKLSYDLDIFQQERLSLLHLIQQGHGREQREISEVWGS
jgi:hypothetical protein